jgi:arabinoxylan arabinofuranohydrolase
MKNNFIKFFFLLLMILIAGFVKAQNMPANPFVRSIYTADPSAHVWADGRLYVYPSHDIAPARGADLMDQYHVFSTADMVNWTDHGEILRASQVPWGRTEGGFMWAPDCAFKNGTYYFYFPHPSGTDWNTTWKIGVATSTSPASGFTVQGFIPGLESLIDPCVFVDDDGQAYFYYGGGGVCKGGKLNANMMQIDGTMQNMQGLTDFHEATWVHKRNGIYYLSYADNHDVGDAHNQMQYATSTSPLGPWTSRGVYIDPTDSYTDHGSIVEYKGQSYAFYHNSSLSGDDWLRSICVDKLFYNADGTIQKVIQTKGHGTPYGGTARAIPGTIQAEDYDVGGPANAYADSDPANSGGQYRTTEGVDIETCGEGGFDVGFINKGEWMEYTVNVASTGTYTLNLRVATESTPSSIQVEFGGVDKTGVMTVPATGAWQTYTNISKSISLTAGQQIMTVRMRGGAFNFNYVSLASTGVAPVVSSSGTATGTVSTAFSYNITASNSPTSYGASGLPSGLSVNTSTGVISGTPTTAGTFNATVTATNASGTGSKTVVITISSSTAQNDLNQKLMMGYQGWFLCSGDGSAPNEWRHWFQSTTTPTADQLNVDIWPDMTEYTKTYNTSMTYSNGTTAKLFSSHDQSTTNTHFKWMQDYNVYGVYLQRFLGEAVNDQRFFQVRNNVLQNVINASATYGRHFSIMYDLSGVADDGNLYNKLITDWEYLVNTYDVANKPGYVKQEGLPVLAIWGIGFRDRGLNPATFQQIINYFHNTAAPKYRAYIVGGVPDSWRTLNNDSESDPAWTAIYHSLDMISPWAVGRYSDVNGADAWKTNKIIPDMSDCNANNVDYMPVIFPGFSWNNMHDGASTSPLNQIPRAGGNFYWRQAYNAVSAGSKFVYVAMFDEVDEGTAMFKMAANNAAAPVQGNFVTADEDGQVLPSDWYLRLANETQKMLSGISPVTPTIPISPNGGAPVVSSSNTATGTMNTSFSYTITASNTPTSFGASSLPAGLSVNTSTGVISGTPTTAGTFSATVSATNSSGTGTQALTITINNQTTQNIPGTIQAENYCAMSGIQLETTSDTGAGQNVGWIDAGDWLDYCVTVATAGTYTVSARVASPNTGGQFQLKLGSTVLNTMNVTNTGGWQTWTTITSSANLSAGTQTIRLQVVTGGFNINWLQFSSSVSVPVISSAGTASGTINSAFTYSITASNNPTSYGVSGLPAGLSVNTSTGVISGTPTTAGTFNATITATNAGGTGSKALTITINSASQSPYPNGTPWPIPGTIEVENFDFGGEGVAYHDNDAINSGGQGRTSDGVDTETCSEGTLNIGWTNTGEWYEYTVNVATTGTYNVDVREASQLAGGTFHIEFNGVDKTGLFTTVNTGAWQTWTTISKTGIALTAGTQVMRIYLDNANFNLNKLVFSTIDANVPVTSVAVSPTSQSLNVGGTLQLTATVSPSNASNKSVTWSSNNTSIASVNSTGLVTALAAGTAIITVTTVDGGKTATSTITVITTNVPVTGVTVSPTSQTLNAGATTQLTATVSPSNATNKNVTWSSNNTSVASVNSSGLVTASAAGTATITVTTVDGGKTATSAITVNVPIGTLVCKKASVAITVNGSLSETSWSVVTNSITKVTVGTGNNTATFGVLWDNTNLYIGAKVLDANLFSDSPDAWDDDAIEVYIDANNNRLTTYDGLDNQIIKNYNKSTVFTKLAITGLQHAWAAISGGYSVEIAIPWSQLGISAPAQGTTIGFDIGYDDDDNGSTRDAQAVWNGTVNNYANTSGFGSLVLNNATAREATVDELATTEKEIVYWPTIVEHELNIQTDGSYHSVEVIDMLGRSNYRDESIKDKKSLVLDLGHLAGGVHFVQLRAAEQLKTIRIIKK